MSFPLPEPVHTKGWERENDHFRGRIEMPSRASRLVPPAATMATWHCCNLLQCPPWLGMALATLVYLCMKVLLRSRAAAPGRAAAPAEPAAPAAARTFGNTPLSQQAPADEALKRRKAAAKKLGNVPLSMQ